MRYFANFFKACIELTIYHFQNQVHFIECGLRLFFVLKLVQFSSQKRTLQGINREFSFFAIFVCPLFHTCVFYNTRTYFPLVFLIFFLFFFLAISGFSGKIEQFASIKLINAKMASSNGRRSIFGRNKKGKKVVSEKLQILGSA